MINILRKYLSQKNHKKNSITITIDDVGVENPKSNECKSLVDGKLILKNSNNYKYSSSTHKSNSNECTLPLCNNSKESSSTQ